MVLVFVGFTLLLSLLPVLWLWKAAPKSRRDWLVTFFACCSLVIFVFLAAPWALLSYYLRFVLLLAFALAAIASYRRLRQPSSELASRHTQNVNLALKVLLLVIILYLDTMVVQSYAYEGTPVEISFPLKGKSYYVLQGGNSRITNFFHSLHPSQRLALDIVKLNAFGNRAVGIAPTNLSNYLIFGEAVYSPCPGTVISAVDGLPDLMPGQVNTEHPAGNHVWIRCKGVRILLAHLQHGSVRIKEGSLIEEGQILGRVGNSGNTMEPHLHISAESGGTIPGSAEAIAVPILFSGRFLTLNSLFNSLQ